MILTFLVSLVTYSAFSTSYFSALSYDPQLQFQVDTEIELIRDSRLEKSPPPSPETPIPTPILPAVKVVEVKVPQKQSLIDFLAEQNSLSPMKCPEGMVRVNDTHIPESHDTTNRKIPKIIFQTSKSRCLTPRLHKLTELWRFEGWSYYFYDDEAMMRLLHQDFDEFPHLKLIVENCVKHGTIKADLWRYAALWRYGGLYADVDSIPTANFTKNTIQPQDDSFFVVEHYNILSQYFMASSARHPLIYYTLHKALANLLTAKDTGKFNAAVKTGPHALHNALRAFMNDAGVEIKMVKLNERDKTVKPVMAGLYTGTNNRTVRVIGEGKGLSNDWIIRESVQRGAKVADYKKMNMTHNYLNDRDNPTFQSCISAIILGR